MKVRTSQPSRTRAGRPKTYDRESALTAATLLFWTRGYSATSIRDLVRAMRMVPKSVYAEFGAKDELFVAAIEHYVEEQTQRYRDQLGTGPFGLDPIARYFESFHIRQERRGCFLVNSLAECTSIPRRALVRVQAFFDWLKALYARNLKAAASDGKLRPGVHIDHLASAFVVYDQGLAIASRSKAQVSDLSEGALSLLAAIRV